KAEKFKFTVCERASESRKLKMEVVGSSGDGPTFLLTYYTPPPPPPHSQQQAGPGEQVALEISSSSQQLVTAATVPTLMASSQTTWNLDLDPPETSEVDSSGESDDTVIEDVVPGAVSAPPTSDPAVSSNDLTSSPASSAGGVPPEVKETPPARSERKLMQVPTINVIETDEPNFSDEEMDLELEEEDDYEVVKEAEKTGPEPEDTQAAPKTRPLETEFMEGYSPPSSPVDSDAEYSPKHQILASHSDADLQESAAQTDVCPEPSQTMSTSFSVTNQGTSFPANEDEWSDEARDVLVDRGRSDLTAQGRAPSSMSKSSFMQDDLPPPTMVMDLEQEELTISALRELGSSQEDEEEAVAPWPKLPDLDHNETCVKQSSISPVANTPVPQSLVCDSTYSCEVEAIDVWVAEAYHLAEHVLTAVLTHLSVKDLIHWRDPKKSGVVFGVSMLLLLSLAAFSVISVVSYLLLALLCVTITFRIYKSVVQAVQKSNDGHPFKALIDKDVSIPPENFRKHVDVSLTYINRALKQMSRLFLVEDLVDSLKLAVVMWLLTYVGAVFNGITILILADILLFAVPPIYEKNKTQIDQYIDIARTQINSTMAKLQEKLPGAMKRSKTE
ncbi:unnamed protein product, partial [Lampetra planeri]